MFPGINPKKIQEMMRSMGIKQEDIEASRVIIECEDKNIIIWRWKAEVLVAALKNIGASGFFMDLYNI